jgi:uncharacterized membrane protein YkoI
MPVIRIPAVAVLPAILLGILTAPASAAEPDRNSPHLACLDQEAQREVLASGRAVPLAQAIHTIRPKNKGEVVSARLCRGPDGLVYVLTLLSRNGKVTRTTVDAANGTVLGGG